MARDATHEMADAGEPDAADKHSHHRTGKAAAPRDFDGVICFGDSDWWYHNHGHYDMQMMRQMAQHVPVLYINSIGVRVPSVSEGGMFVQRMRRKIQSLRRGLVTVQKNFSVFSPFVVPGKLGMHLSHPLMLLQVRWAARRLGIRHPLVWVVCPPAAAIVGQLRPAGLIYQRTDAYEDFPGVDANLIRRLDRRMKARADVTLFCSSYVLAREARDCRNAMFLDHGVDFDRFAAAGRTACGHAPDGAASTNCHGDTCDRSCRTPCSMHRIGRPRVGFVGGIDSHTFDPDLFTEVACRLPDVQFILVGACSLPRGWCRSSNVSLLGQQPYDHIADYMAACDVLIMPWNRSAWIQACNPIKLKEYLAVGRPIVSTPFEELRRYDGLVHVAEDCDSFAAHVRRALSHPLAAETLRERVRHETWQARGCQVLAELARVGVHPRSSG